MKSGAIRRALGLSILYIGLFVLLVLLQFSRGPGLSVTVGGLSASASYPKADRGKAGAAPDKVDISFAGLSFEISPSSKAESLAADGSVTTLALVSVARLPDGLGVKLSGGIELRATADKEERFSLAASAPDGVAGVRLRLLPSRTRFVQDDAKSKVVSGNGAAYTVALASGSLDGSAGLLLLKPGDAGLSLAKEAQSQPKVARAPSIGKAVAQAPKDPDAFKAEIGAWRDKAWAGLSQGRFDADKLVWKAADGSSGFSERALAAYLAEALARGSYPDAFAKVKVAKERWPDRLGALTAPYFGSLVLKMKVAEAADQAEVKRLAQLLDAKSQVALEREGILRFVYERSPYPLLQELLVLCSSQDPAKLTIRQDVGLLGCVVDARSLLKDEDDSIKDGGSAADRLVAATRQTADGYFLATEDDDSTDLRLSLLAGTCLVAYGNRELQAPLCGRRPEPRRGGHRPFGRAGPHACAAKRQGRLGPGQVGIARARGRLCLGGRQSVLPARHCLRPRYRPRPLGLDLLALSYPAGEPLTLRLPLRLPRGAVAFHGHLRHQTLRQYPALRHRLQPRQQLRGLRRLGLPLR